MQNSEFDVLIRHGTAITADPDAPVIEDAVIGILADTIAYVGKDGEGSQPHRGRRVIEANGHVVIPGFVNTHTHTLLTIVRGVTEDLGFAPAYTPGIPHGHDFTPDEAYALARLGALELLLFGTTLINDSYVHAEVTLPAMGELGMRVVACDRIHDVDFSRVADGVWEYDDAIGERSMRDAFALADRWDGGMNGRLGVQLAPHATDTCSTSLLRQIDEVRREKGMRVNIHLAQSDVEFARVMERDGKTPVELLEDVGLLDDRLIAAHCLKVTPDDIQRLGRAGINLAHPPKVNAMGGMRAQTSALRRAGVQICITTDGMHGDILEVMRWALAIGRLQEGAVTDFWQPRQVFEMTNIVPARAMGMEQSLGSLTVGKKADLVILDFDRPHLVPCTNALGNLVHVAQGRDVRYVMVDGVLVVEDGAPTQVDEEEIRAEAGRASRALWERAGPTHLARNSGLTS